MFNSPMVFNAIWALIKPFLHKNTTDKMSIKGWSGGSSTIVDVVDGDVELMM